MTGDSGVLLTTGDDGIMTDDIQYWPTRLLADIGIQPSILWLRAIVFLLLIQYCVVVIPVRWLCNDW